MSTAKLKFANYTLPKFYLAGFNPLSPITQYVSVTLSQYCDRIYSLVEEFPYPDPEPPL